MQDDNSPDLCSTGDAVEDLAGCFRTGVAPRVVQRQPCTHPDRVRAEQERLARWWAGVVTSTVEWQTSAAIRDEILGELGISGDLRAWRISRGSQHWVQFVDHVRAIASGDTLRVVRGKAAT